MALNTKQKRVIRMVGDAVEAARAPAKRAKANRLTGEQADAATALELAQQRVDLKKAEASQARKRKVTPYNKTRHAVLNEDVHSQNSSARQVDARSEVDRESEQPTAWRRASALSAPTPRPAMKQKWVRYRAGKDEDTDNLDRYLEEGWRPRMAESVRKGHELTADTRSKYAQYIVKRGLILMEIPEHMAAQRAKAYRNKAARMTEGIDNDMFKLDNPVMPLLNPSRKTRVDTRIRRGAKLEDRMSASDE